MEKMEEEQEEACFSLEHRRHYHYHHRSEQIHVCLSDLNKRMQTAATLLEENGKSSRKSHICFETRPELIQIFEELDRSYHSLAEKFNQFKWKLHQVSTADAISSSSSDTDKYKRLVAMSGDCVLEDFGSYPFCIAGNPDAKSESIDSDFEYLDKLAEELMLPEQGEMKTGVELKIMKKLRGKEIAELCGTELEKDFLKSFEKNSCSKLEVQLTELMEVNLQYQRELARRNIEKKVEIKKLQLQVAQLEEENRALQNCISCSKVGDKYNQLRTPKLRTLFSDKIFQGCS